MLQSLSAYRGLKGIPSNELQTDAQFDRQAQACCDLKLALRLCFVKNVRRQTSGTTITWILEIECNVDVRPFSPSADQELAAGLDSKRGLQLYADERSNSC